MTVLELERTIDDLRDGWISDMNNGVLPDELELLGLLLEPGEIHELLIEMASGTRPCTTCCTQCASNCCNATC